MRKWFFNTGIVLSLFLSFAWGGYPKAMIIFDASGSMWGQIDGVNKIVIARNALRDVVNRWNPNIYLGLTVYGHRVKGDCNDIETMIPIGPVNRGRMINTVMGIQPKGMTPIAKSLRRVADQLRKSEEQATIILISDGKESCDQDPCATARQLKREGINFVAHVVGFNVDASTDRQLACIANATGGEYFSAKNAAALNRAIKVIAKKVEKPKPKKTLLKLEARYKTLGKNSAPVPGVKWFVVQNGKSVYNNDRPDDYRPKIPLKVGKAHIKMVYDRSTRAQTIEGDIVLKPQKENVVIVYIESGSVTVDAAEEEGSPKVKSSIHIYPDKNSAVEKGDVLAWCISTPSKPCIRTLPAGDYLLEAAYQGMKTERKFTISGNDKKQIHLYFKPTGKAAFSVSETEGGALVRGNGSIFKAGGERISGIYTNKKGPYLYRLPVGKYYINMDYKLFKKEKIPFEIKAGETTKVHVVFAPFHISVKGINPCIYLHFELVAGDGRSVAGKNGPAKEGMDVVVPNGKYFVEISWKGARKRSAIEVGNGQNRVDVDFGGDGSGTGIEGVWRTTEGKAVIYLDGRKVHGRYTNDHGELEGEIRYSRRFEGYWTENTSSEKCSEARNGRYYWGRVVWEFDKDMCSFKGKWNYCGKEPAKNWSGKYLRPLNKEERRRDLIESDRKNSMQSTLKKSVPKKTDAVSPDKLRKFSDAMEKSGLADKKSIENIKRTVQKPQSFGNSTGGETAKKSAPVEDKSDKELEEMGKDIELFSK